MKQMSRSYVAVACAVALFAIASGVAGIPVMQSNGVGSGSGSGVGALRMVSSPLKECGRDPTGLGACVQLETEGVELSQSLRSVGVDEAIRMPGFVLGANVRGDLLVERFSVVQEADSGASPSVVLLHGQVLSLENRALSSQESAASHVFLALSVHGSNGYAQVGNRTFILSTPWETQAHERMELKQKAQGSMEEKLQLRAMDAMDAYVAGLARGAAQAFGGNSNQMQVAGVRTSVAFEATGMDLPLPQFASERMSVDSVAAPYVETVTHPRTGEKRYTFRVASDVDYDMYRKKGNNYDATSSFYSTLVGATNSIYARDFASGLKSVYLKIYTSPDGYPCCSSSQALDYMRRTWSPSTPSRSLAALVSAKNLGGGIAYFRTLCNTNYAYAINGNMVGYFPTPVQNYNGQNWDIYVFAHEVGHVFGASHTHELNPPADYCGSTPGCGATRGTIMSYCHLCSGGIANIEMAFHSRTKSEVTGFINNLAC